MKTAEVPIGDVEVGDVVHFEGEPRRVTEVDEVGGGKHGDDKVSLRAVGLFDDEAVTVSQPADVPVDVVEHETGNNLLVFVRDGPAHFEPPVVTVPAGGTVVWMYDDEVEHEVHTPDGPLAGDRVAGDGYTAEATFDEAGHYRFECAVHGESGAVIVEEA